VEARRRLGDALLSPSVTADEALRDACAEHSERAFGKREVRPTPVHEADRLLFPDAPREGPATSEAMRGFLLALGMSIDPATRLSPQPVRGHLFFHNLQNLWVCCNPQCSQPGCKADLREQERAAHRPVAVGALHPRHQLSCGGDCGGRVLDLIVCEVCGEVFLGGFRKSPKQRGYRDEGAEILTADQTNLEDIPVLAGCAVAHPLAPPHQHGLARLHVEGAAPYSTRSVPRSTSVYSSNSGVWPGSAQPPGLRMWAMLTAASPLFTLPTYSSISFGLLPAAVIRVGFPISVGMVLLLALPCHAAFDHPLGQPSPSLSTALLPSICSPESMVPTKPCTAGQRRIASLIGAFRPPQGFVGPMARLPVNPMGAAGARSSSRISGGLSSSCATTRALVTPLSVRASSRPW
jgi:hypothetical protein